MVGRQRRDTSSATMTPSTEVYSFAGFGRWAFGIGQPRRDRRGRTDIVKGRSVRSGGNVLTTLSCAASCIFAICCDLTRPTITRLARTFQSTRTRRRREQLCVPKIRFCNIDGEGRQGQVVRRRRRGAQSRGGEGRPCSEIDGSSTHYNRRHLGVGSGAGALRQTRSCGRDIRGGSSR